ncbi:hypothetical protein QYM36_005831 [Artemia franciscana]|uniref:Reverse transcriptase domain-containing protein n=1 Tax=Artemia franciscana TaxID=6661 RepID=A0AA88L6C8_ARTSF|nr:hypothetical protein QYM36_005831 [Artemia franciscana]
MFIYRQKKINIFNIYNPDGSENNLREAFEQMMQSVLSRELIIAVGNFNAHSESWCTCGRSNNAGRDIEDFLMNNNDLCLLTPKDLPTHLNHNTGQYSTIDLVFSSPHIAPTTKVTSLKNTVLYSDHLPVMIELNGCNNIQANNIAHKFKLKKTDWKTFSTALKNVHIEEQLKKVSSSEEKIKIFQTILMDVVDKVVPKINTHKLNHKVTKWWNETCTKAKQDLKDAKSNYECLPTFHGYVEYRRKAAEFKKTVIAAKRESWIIFLNKLDFRVPASRVYSTVKSLISGSREDQTNPPITYKNSTLVTDQEIAEAAVSLLDSVIGVPDPLSDCEIEVKAKVKRFSKSHRSEAYNQPFFTQEIEKVINHLPLTAPGEDMIFPQFVKALPKNWVAALLNIINELWNEGQFPKIWKDGVVVLIPKVGKDKSKLENYRTITLLPVLGKVYERLVKQRMNQVIELNRGLKNIQCGFRRNRNTEDVMLMFMNDAVYALENKKVLLMAFLDVVSAFERTVGELLRSPLNRPTPAVPPDIPYQLQFILHISNEKQLADELLSADKRLKNEKVPG